MEKTVTGHTGIPLHEMSKIMLWPSKYRHQNYIISLCFSFMTNTLLRAMRSGLIAIPVRQIAVAKFRTPYSSFSRPKEEREKQKDKRKINKRHVAREASLQYWLTIFTAQGRYIIVKMQVQLVLQSFVL